MAYVRGSQGNYGVKKSATQVTRGRTGAWPAKAGTGETKTDPFVSASINTQNREREKEADPFITAIINSQPHIAGRDSVQGTATPYAAAAQSGEPAKTESGYKRGGSSYRVEDDPFIKAITNIQVRENVNGFPTARGTGLSRLGNSTGTWSGFGGKINGVELDRREAGILASELRLGEATDRDFAAYLGRIKQNYGYMPVVGSQEDMLDQVQSYLRSRQPKVGPFAGLRTEIPESGNSYKRSEQMPAARKAGPLVEAVMDAQKSRNVERTSAAVGYDLDELNKHYYDLRQEAEAWESQSMLQSTPEEMSEWEGRSRAKRREADALLPKLEALQRELDMVKAAEKKTMMEQGGYREANLKDILINSFKQGYLSAEHGKESYKEMMGDEDTRKAEYEEILAGEGYKFVPMHWWEEGISGAASLLGQQLSQAADPYTLALMGGFGGMAAAAGQAGPQVLIPEEVVTVPAALASGFAAGSAMNNIRIEAGNSYNELLEHGVSENTARAIAGAVGGINGALESLQLESLLKSFNILKSTGASRTALGLIVEELKRRGLDVANNVAQEVLQEGTTIAGTQLGTKMETGEWAYGAGEVADRLKDTAVSSALAFSAMNVPGTVRSIGSNLSVGGTVGNTGQGVAAGKGTVFETLDTDTGLGYDTFISTRTGGTQDEQGAHRRDSQAPAELSGLADTWQAVSGGVDSGGDGALSAITSGRTGRTYQFRKITAERFNQKQNVILKRAVTDGVEVSFAEDGIVKVSKDGQEIETESFRGVYLGDGQIILSSDGISYDHELFHHYEMIHKDAALRFSEIVQQQIRMGNPKVMAFLEKNVTAKNLQSEIAASVFNSLQRGRFAEWDGFFSNPEAVRLAYERFLAESGVRGGTITLE